MSTKLLDPTIQNSYLVSTKLPLHLFTQPALLEQIGHIRLPMFLKAFAEELKAAGVSLPEPPSPDERRMPEPPPDSAQAMYFKALALVFCATGSLPTTPS